jgi:hypothetical protein
VVTTTSALPFRQVSHMDCVVRGGSLSRESKERGLCRAPSGVASARPIPPPLRPELSGLLLTGGTPLYLHADVTGGSGDTATTSTAPLWWPGGKIAARHLGHYLAHAPTIDATPDP